MPVQYSGVIEEHNTTRTKAGLFDTCHMGEFLIEGKDAFELIQKVVAKDISKLEKGRCCYSVMCNSKGGVIDDLFIYNLGDSRFMLVVNAGTIEKDFSHLDKKKKGFAVSVKNISDDMAKLDLQGPESEKILSEFLGQGFNLDRLKRFSFIELIKDRTYFLISRSGYTGEDGFELYFDAKKASAVWNILIDIGKKYGCKPVGLGARDTLRLECCYSLYGHELSEDIDPFTAGIQFAVSLDKDFIGKPALMKKKAAHEKISIAFEMQEKSIPREHYPVFQDSKEIGYVSSGTMSPTFKKGLGMAFVDLPASAIGTNIEISIRDKMYKAVVVKKPFYEYKGKR